MTYTGDTTPDTRTLPALTITKLSVGPMDNNAYLLRCSATGQQLLVDAANEPDRLFDLIGDRGLSTVVTTHRHGDHWQALASIVDGTGARSIAHELDAPELPIESDTVAEGDTISVGDVDLEVIHIVGHTPGSIALLYHDPAGHSHLWTGDSLFPGGPGRTTNPSDFISLMGDLESKIFGRFPDDTWFYPGHGKDSTLGRERGAIPEWRARGW